MEGYSAGHGLCQSYGALGPGGCGQREDRPRFSRHSHLCGLRPSGSFHGADGNPRQAALRRGLRFIYASRRAGRTSDGKHEGKQEKNYSGKFRKRHLRRDHRHPRSIQRRFKERSDRPDHYRRAAPLRRHAAGSPSGKTVEKRPVDYDGDADPEKPRHRHVRQHEDFLDSNHAQGPKSRSDHGDQRIGPEWCLRFYGAVLKERPTDLCGLPAYRRKSRFSPPRGGDRVQVFFPGSF